MQLLFLPFFLYFVYLKSQKRNKKVGDGAAGIRLGADLAIYLAMLAGSEFVVVFNGFFILDFSEVM